MQVQRTLPVLSPTCSAQFSADESSSQSARHPKLAACGKLRGYSWHACVATVSRDAMEQAGLMALARQFARCSIPTKIVGRQIETASAGTPPLSSRCATIHSNPPISVHNVQASHEPAPGESMHHAGDFMKSSTHHTTGHVDSLGPLVLTIASITASLT